MTTANYKTIDYLDSIEIISNEKDRLAGWALFKDEKDYFLSEIFFTENASNFGFINYKKIERDDVCTDQIQCGFEMDLEHGDENYKNKFTVHPIS